MKWAALLSYITILCPLDPPPGPTVHWSVETCHEGQGQEALGVTSYNAVAVSDLAQRVTKNTCQHSPVQRRMYR